MSSLGDEWAAKANEALEISLYGPHVHSTQNAAAAASPAFAPFPPRFTYAIFGDDERIFGYKNLHISLRYRAYDMLPKVLVNYDRKFKQQGDVSALDIPATLKQHLPDIAFHPSPSTALPGTTAAPSSSHSDDLRQAIDFTPPGTKFAAFTQAGQAYEIWTADLRDAAMRQFLRRIQILTVLFIEGASYIGGGGGGDDDQEADTADLERWHVYLLFRKDPVPEALALPEVQANGGKTPYVYVFQGFSTVYHFYYFQPADTSTTTTTHLENLPVPPSQAVSMHDLPTRVRLSQFFILPPFRSCGLGSTLYRRLYRHYLALPNVLQFVVEDPNEAFDDLRDINDFEYVRSLPEFRERIRLRATVPLPRRGPAPTTIVDGQALQELQRKTKLSSRQFSRLVEMYLLSTLPDSVRPTLDVKDLDDDDDGWDDVDDQDDGDDQDHDDDQVHDGQPTQSTKAVSQEVSPRATAEDKHRLALWKVYVKQRLYRHNREVLQQVPVLERPERLEATLQSVLFGYMRVLALAEKRSSMSGEDASGGGGGVVQKDGAKEEAVEDEHEAGADRAETKATAAMATATADGEPGHKRKASQEGRPPREKKSRVASSEASSEE